MGRNHYVYIFFSNSVSVVVPGGRGAVGRKIDMYVRPVPEKIDQVRWKFFMKKGAGQVENYKGRPY